MTVPVDPVPVDPVPVDPVPVDPAPVDSAPVSTGAVDTGPVDTVPAPRQPGPRSRTVRQLLERLASQRGQATALLDLDRPPLSFVGLAALVEARRRVLLDLGLGRGDRVALVSSPHAAGAAAFLSIASLTACAPLRPLASRQELDFGLRDLRAKAVVIEQDLPTEARRVAADLGLPVIDLKAMPGPAGQFTFEARPLRQERHDEPTDQRDVALLLHTTGSTARPKLVPFTQSSLAHTAWGTARALGLSVDDRCLTFMPLFHVHGLVSGLLVPLTAGSSVACVGDFDREAFPRWLDALRPTWYSTSPAMHHIILRQIRRRAGDRSPAPSLRFVRSGSAVMPESLADGLAQTLGVPVIEAYGMTEVPNISGNPVAAPRRGSVGRSAAARLGRSQRRARDRDRRRRRHSAAGRRRGGDRGAGPERHAGLRARSRGDG